MTDRDHGIIGFEINCRRGGEVFGVGEVLEGEDGVKVGEGRISIFTDGEGERNTN